MCTSDWQANISSFVSPAVSLPNTKATGPVISTARSAAVRTSNTCGDHSRERADRAKAWTQSWMVSFRLETTWAASRTSTALVAIHCASGAGKRSGATSRRSRKPIALIARAAAPMLPGWLGRQSTNLIEFGATPDFPMHPILNIAVRAARRAGSLINRATLEGGTLEVRSKRANDFVTQVDRAAEQAIIETVRKAYPGHGFLCEESGASAADAEVVWIIDPLDGTTNFIHGFPQYCVSLAVKSRGALAHAVVYDPLRNELFTASKGHGAYLNDRRIRVSKVTRLNEALVGTGFPFKELTRIELYMRQLQSLMAKSSGVRRAGAAALDLAYVACG